MFDQHFLSPAPAADVFGPLQGGERVMWRGRCGVAEYAFDEAASLPRWTLPETTDVLVTDHRVLYAYTADDGEQVRSGELRWLWPQHLRVQPGARSTDRGAAATQIQLVCGGTDGTYPALVFAGGELATVGDADRLANVIRQAIARFRVDNVDKLGLTASQGRMLSRLLIGPEFRNHQGGDGQTVSLLGAMLVHRPAPVPLAEAEVLSESPLDDPFLEVFAADEALLADAIFAADAILPAGAAYSAGATLPADAALSADAAFPTDAALSADAAFPTDAAYSADAAFPTDAALSADAAFPTDAAYSAGLSADVAGEAFPADAALPAVDAIPADLSAYRDDRPIAEGTRLITYRPGRAADAARALMAAKAEEATQQSEPATASRAAELAARIASLVSRFPESAPALAPAPRPAASPSPASAPIAQDQHPEPESFHSQDPQQLQGRLEDRPTDDQRSFGARLTEMRSVDAGRPEESGSPEHEAWSRGPWPAEPELGKTRRAVSRHSEPRQAELYQSEPRQPEFGQPEFGQPERSQPGRPEIGRPGPRHAEPFSAERLAERAATERAAAERMAAERADMPTTNLAQRAESMRRTAARMAANAARGRVSERRTDREPGVSTRGNRTS